ncbi:hypothetical protein ACFWY6_17155 [Streptomyces sp. NPDC059037]|uniref:hypothetical protein n=1 Tax=Streptomyces sp. NPDC059037 TaxID=3346710 RepID=UPI0036C17C4A
MIIGIAQREGTGGPIAVAAATYTSTSTGMTAAALVDGMGHGAEIVRLAPMLAETTARVGAARGAMAGILSAGLLLADPGEPDAVGVCAVSLPTGGAEVAWAGDSAAWHWDGEHLERLTTDATLAAYLSRAAGEDIPVHALADYVGITLGRAIPATVRYVSVPAGGHRLLTTDGIHDQMPPGAIESLAHKHSSDPQALADALVAAARPDADGYRDDASAVVVS